MAAQKPPVSSEDAQLERFAGFQLKRSGFDRLGAVGKA